MTSHNEVGWFLAPSRRFDIHRGQLRVDGRGFVRRARGRAHVVQAMHEAACPYPLPEVDRRELPFFVRLATEPSRESFFVFARLSDVRFRAADVVVRPATGLAALDFWAENRLRDALLILDVLGHLRRGV